jgi:hydrogenase maturation protease
MRTRVIGLGNTILSDDGVGVYAVREIEGRLASEGIGEDVSLVETEVAGFALMELLTGWERVILIDSIQFDDVRPGTVIEIDPQDLRTSLRLRSVHDIDLPTVLALGRKLGLPMPDEVKIVAIQAEDALTLGESLTATVARGMKEAVDLVMHELSQSPALLPA